MHIIKHINRYINYKMGLAGAVLMGSIVFYINYMAVNTFWPAMTAASKQFAYTFLFGGMVIRGCEYLAIRFNSRFKSLLLATLVPSAITLLLVFGVHNMKGTPKPLASTMPTLIIVPGTFFWALRKRKKNS